MAALLRQAIVFGVLQPAPQRFKPHAGDRACNVARIAALRQPAAGINKYAVTPARIIHPILREIVWIARVVVSEWKTHQRPDKKTAQTLTPVTHAGQRPHPQVDAGLVD